MTEPSLARRLTSIVAIDVVGFSTMSARNEEHALKLLDRRLTIVRSFVKQRRGREFKMTGDGLLAEFASPVEAVRTATEIQEAMRAANAQAGPQDQLNLRIGVNLGDVVENGDDLMGDAVNVAVRLESIAPTGGVCVSGAIHEQIIGKLTLGVEDMGEQHVKNIPRPIHAYRLTADGSAPATGVRTGIARLARRRVRLGVAAGAAAIIVAVGLGGWWLLRSSPVSEAMAGEGQASIVAAPQPVPVAAAPAKFVAAEVPFVAARRRRDLEEYERAEGAKALAITIRGIAISVSRRVDDATARRMAMENCTAAAQRASPGPVRESERCMLYAVGNSVIWTFRTPAMPPLPYLQAARQQPAIAPDPAVGTPIGDPARRNLMETYAKASRKKAFVIGRNRYEGWSTSDTEVDAARRALQSCGHLTGRPCTVFALGDVVVARTPQKMKIVDVFTPQDLPGLDPAQQAAVERYLVTDDWRAIAVARNGRIGVVSGRQSEEAAIDGAVRECARLGGTECAVSAIGAYLVAR